MTLHLDDGELATCVGCGLCLPHCPTFRVTGREAYSPRGRIALMRSIQWGGAPVTPEVVEYVETCVQCRGCEPACPSGVPYGHLMEGTRAALAAEHAVTPRWQRWAYRALGRHRTLVAGSRALAVAQRAHLVPKRLGLPRLPVRDRPLEATGSDVWLFTGCVMDAWMRDTHRAVIDVLGRAGWTVALPGAGGDCCGALHAHAGLVDDARRLVTRAMASMPGTAPVVVDSAGCGAALRDAGHLLGTDEATTFAGRVVDVHELVATRLDRLPAPRRRLGPVIVQDPCHLRHVQRVDTPVRAVLGLVADPVELDDDGLCCGAGGAYAALQPELAAEIRARKLAAIDRAARRSGATVVASANPGCAMHLAAAGLTVRHPIDLVAAALS